MFRYIYPLNKKAKKLMKNGSSLNWSREYPKDKDPREELFNYAIESKWIVTEMSPHSVNLESIFRTLTMEEGADA